MTAHWPEPAKKRTTRKALPVVQRTLCHACRMEFPRYTAWERHSDQTGHHRCCFPLPDYPAFPPEVPQ